MDTILTPYGSEATTIREKEVTTKEEPYDDDCVIVETTEYENPIARLKRLKGFDLFRTKKIESENGIDDNLNYDSDQSYDDYMPSSDHSSRSSSAARTATPPLSCQAAVKRTHWPRQHQTPPPTPTPSRKRKAEASTDVTTPEGSPFPKFGKGAPRTPVRQNRRSSKMLTPLSGTRDKDHRLGAKRKRSSKDMNDEYDGGLWDEPRIPRRKKVKVTPILVESGSEWGLIRNGMRIWEACSGALIAL